MWSDITLDPSFKDKQGYRNLKVLISGLFVFIEVCSVTLTCRKSWAKNLLMLSDFTLGSSFKIKQWLNGIGELSGEYNLQL